MPSNRWQHWLVRIAAGTTIALIAGVVAGWLAFQHIPSWYAPPVVGEADLARVRASLPESYQTFTDRLAEGGTFEFELSARRINEWIAARGALWPDARDVLPVWLREPVVGFLPDRIVVAARYERGGWRAILSAHLTLEVVEGALVVRLVKLAAGSLPLPMASTVEALDRHIAGLVGRGDPLPEGVARWTRGLDRSHALGTLRRGLRVENRFHWSNGERRFRVVDVRIGDGVVTLTVETL